MANPIIQQLYLHISFKLIKIKIYKDILMSSKCFLNKDSSQ